LSALSEVAAILVMIGGLLAGHSRSTPFMAGAEAADGCGAIGTRLWCPIHSLRITRNCRWLSSNT
jgi:hypothetical protein